MASESKSAAYNAIFEEIERQLKSEELNQYTAHDQAKIVRDLALAFRYASGGAQPGGGAVDGR